ncbi:MAG: hypothetical protein OQK99_01830, partial [Gammaproteobacteria bacterium]|nr:hypothetical protein [Gammaproteobacteria bacterium]
MNNIAKYTGGSIAGLILLMSGVLHAQETQSADDTSAAQTQAQTQVQSQTQIRNRTGDGKQTRQQQMHQPAQDQAGANGQGRQGSGQGRQSADQAKG